MTLYKWSQPALADATADSTINWAEGQAPSSVNDSARAMMAATAKYRDDISGSILTTDTSTSYQVSSNQGFDSLSKPIMFISLTAVTAGLALLPYAPKWTIPYGDISYVFYLIHWPIVCLSSYAPTAYRFERFYPPNDLGELWRWVLFAIIVALANLSWFIVERPINRWARKQSLTRLGDAPALRAPG